MASFLQAILGGFSQGCVYALVALGYSVIYSTLRMGHFAQGDFYMLGCFLGVTFYVRLGLPILLVFVLAAFLNSLIMLGFERTIYRPMYRGSPMALIMTTMGMQYVLQEIAKIIWGAAPVRFLPFFTRAVYQFKVFGSVVSLSTQNVLVISVSISLMIVLTIFITKTKTGLAMLAIAMNSKATTLMGVRVNTLITTTYVMAAAFSAVAGVLMGPLYNASFTMGGLVGAKAMTAAMMGGFGSFPGAVLGGILYGIVETLGSLYITARYKDAFSFIMLALVLIIRPQGLLGKKSITKV
jgi:branched-chain amino acid transport system permease protein